MIQDLSFEMIKDLDSQNMFDIITSFPEQVKDAVIIGEKFDGFPYSPTSIHFVILGMGGSAIGGDILNSYFSNTEGTKHLIFTTLRNYKLPGYVNKDTNIIASSYSGGTEETNSAFEEALKICKNIICISSGGKITDTAIKNNIPIIKIPSGYQPRCALGYSFFPMLLSILKTNMFSEEIKNRIRNEINETIDILRKRANEYSMISDNNLAISIATRIKGTIPVIYSSVDGMESVNTRWIRQIQENAKHLAYGGFLPEMNHNEINGFNLPEGFAKNISIIFIKDINTHPRTLRRFDALQNLIETDVKQIITVQSEATSLLARMFDMIYLGDWVSYYLALLNNTDPTPIPLITKLKNYLSQYE
ncbi:bifunctional phosphoglucose/phosphomannose isomerase [Bacteroidetes/Chlorobi group bacterium ChocPot_Mid]|jgi:glucose/mannose-6-phosphate isomerase|nr:MAG: bifunctional phosphoglucose/phosphomannose isomerase [Bacteroidetes/Chlorobi group bacterium ChocPot_Mid]